MMTLLTDIHPLNVEKKDDDDDNIYATRHLKTAAADLDQGKYVLV